METMIGKPTPKKEEQMTEAEYKKLLAEPDERPAFRKFMDKPLSSYSTDQLKAQLESLKAVIAEFQAELKKQPQNQIVRGSNLWRARAAQYEINWEVLNRENPEAKKVYDKWQEIEKRKAKDYEAWRQKVIATEGEEAVLVKWARGEYLASYTPEESDVLIEKTKFEAENGITGFIDLEFAQKAKEAGGVERYWRKINEKSYLILARELETENNPEETYVFENARPAIEEDIKTAETPSSPPVTETIRQK